MLRTAAQENASPGAVFDRVNAMLSAEVPPGMFATCFYALLDLRSGWVRYANAGQDLPYLRHANGSVGELYATGMPLGLMPDARYEERETMLAPGDSLLFYSDGLVEAHNPEREMFGLPRLKALVSEHAGGAALIEALHQELREFTGTGWEQEDDVTLVTVRRSEGDEPVVTE
jgi:serine phosphatase RsbU (regulator of sigma subunit)